VRRYIAGDGSVPNDCPLLPELRDHVDGLCDRCGKKLTGRRKKWCSDACAGWAYHDFSIHHDWDAARAAALERDNYHCVRCGAGETFERKRGVVRSNLSVNHIVPRRGKGYGRGCHHHQANLETLCQRCHVETTKQQNAAARSIKVA
jgi:5-methylcytosine-specific restriction endonuclease McrA